MRVLSAVLVLCLWAFGASQGAGSADAVEATPLGVQTLDCLVDEALPNPPQLAAEGGFSLFYQSLGGVASDGRACTVHRVMNAAGSPPTPVRWRAGEEVLIDMARTGLIESEQDV